MSIFKDDLCQRHSRIGVSGRGTLYALCELEILFFLHMGVVKAP